VAEINDDIKHATNNGTDKFVLRSGGSLEVHSSNRSRAGLRVVVLDEDGVNSSVGKRGFVVAFEEEPSRILKNAWFDDERLVEFGGYKVH